MKSRPACLPCVLLQTQQVAASATEDDWSQRKVLNGVMRGLVDKNWSERPPAEIVADAVATARATLRAADPFENRRRSVEKGFRKIAERFRERIASANDPLALAVTGAAAANVADALILRPQLDCAKEFEALLERGFALGGPETVRKALAAPDVKQVLYLLDNAGEILVDVVLIEEIRKLGIHVRTAVRSAGLLHDATVEEAIDAGLARVIEVEVPVTPSEAEFPALPPKAEVPEEGERGAPPNLVEIPPGVHGTPSVAVSRPLVRVLAETDLVISKGPANYETFTSAAAPVIHLLRAKCEPVAQHFGVHVGDLILKKVGPSKAAAL